MFLPGILVDIILLVAVAAVVLLLASRSDAAPLCLLQRLLVLVGGPFRRPRGGGARPSAADGAVLGPGRMDALLRALLRALVALAPQLRLLRLHHAHAQAAAVAAVVVLGVAQVGLLFLQLKSAIWKN